MSKTKVVLGIALGAMWLCACSNRAAKSSDGGADSVVGADGFMPSGDGASGALSGAVFVATAGVPVPSFIAAGGASAAPRRIGPARGRGYGLGEAGLGFVVATPDGATVIVRLDDRLRREHLFALAADGSRAERPVLIASGVSTREVTLSPDGRELLYIEDRRTLYRVRLDGSDAAAPKRLAHSNEPYVITRPKWVLAAQRVVFEVERSTPGAQTASAIHSARLDGSDGAGSGAQLSQTSTRQHRAASVLPGGRIVASLGDGALWSIGVTGDGGVPVRLTPSNRYARLVGPVDNGAALVVTLAQAANWPRSLALVRADGASAEQPTMLSGERDDLRALISPDGLRLIYVAGAVGSGPSTSWTLYDVVVGLGSKPTPRQIGAAMKQQPVPLSFSPDGRALLVCRNADRSLLRVDLSSGATGQPALLYRARSSQQGCPGHGTVTADGASVLFTAHDDSGGWAAYRVPLRGGAASAVKLATGTVFPLPSGVVHTAFDYRTSALFRSVRGAAPVRLSPWHQARISAAHLVGDRVVYHVDESSRGTDLLAGMHERAAWYAVAADGSGRDQPTRVTPLSDQFAELVALTASRLALRYRGPSGVPPTPTFRAKLVSFALDGSEAQSGGRLLADQPTQVLTAPGGENIAFAARDGSAYVTPLSGPPVEVMRGVSPQALAFDERGARLLVSTQTQVLAAPLDGSGAAAPTVISGVGFVFALSVAPRSGRALLTLATASTAVPHPTSVLTARMSGANAAAAVPLAPDGYLLLRTQPWGAPPVASFPGQQPATPLFDADERSALLRGPQGLYAARLDGSEAAAPRQLLVSPSAHGVQTLPGLALSPDGRSWAVQSDGVLHAVALDGSAAARALTPELAGGAQPQAARWADVGKAIVFASGERLFAARLSGADAAVLRPITVELTRVKALVAITGDGSAAIFQRNSGDDRSLMVAPVRAVGSAPVSAAPLTPIDDAEETFVGFAR